MRYAIVEGGIRDARPFRYTTSQAIILPAEAFERALDAFIPDVIARLRGASVGETNLDCLWRDLTGERADPVLAEHRKLEALLGAEPDEADESLSALLDSDVAVLGRPAVEEIAADGRVVSLAELDRQARATGHALSRGDMIRIETTGIRPGPMVAAWKVGREVAHRVRDAAAIDRAPITDRDLAALAGADARVLSAEQAPPGFSFSLRDADSTERIVLRSPIRVNRRFNLARILGDHLIFGAGTLAPATQAYTYRQKAQRAFAAELLCPSDAIDAATAIDDSLDHQIEVAADFGVSEYVVRLAIERARFESEGDDDKAEVAAA